MARGAAQPTFAEGQQERGSPGSSSFSEAVDRRAKSSLRHLARGETALAAISDSRVSR